MKSIKYQLKQSIAHLTYRFRPVNHIVPLGLKWSLYDKTNSGQVKLKSIEMANLKITLLNEIY